MADRAFVYIDGESHFFRSQEAWRRIHGTSAGLHGLRHIGLPADGLVLVDVKARVFWTRKMNPGVRRAYYFTSFAGDETAQHDVKVKLRQFDLEPYVIPERKTLAIQRQHVLQSQNLIEKPKGVDIALAVRMLEDAHNQSYDVCHLYTSDIDFLPAVETVRGRGKRVCVHGYRDGISSQSPFFHACDQFNDLETVLRSDYEFDPSA